MLINYSAHYLYDRDFFIMFVKKKKTYLCALNAFQFMLNLFSILLEKVEAWHSSLYEQKYY